MKIKNWIEINEGNIVPNLANKDEKKLMRKMNLLKLLDKNEYKKKMESISLVRRSEGLKSEVPKKGEEEQIELSHNFKNGDLITHGGIEGEISGLNLKRGFYSVRYDAGNYTDGENMRVIYIYFKFPNRKTYEKLKEKSGTVEDWHLKKKAGIIK